jgi:hypothetical protein
MIKDAVKFDYCIKESILSVLDVCDYVICCYVESHDGTLEILKSIESDKFKIIELPESEWNVVEGCERLSYITNIAAQEADRLGFTYMLYVQADEIFDSRSSVNLRKAANDNEEAYMCRRINLWGSPYFQLDVPNDRLPCSNYVIRLAKVNYRAVGDAESIGAPANFDYADEIKIWHFGFVRKREVMKDKIINMQRVVFNMSDHDKKLDQSDIFDPTLWFNPDTDLKPINEPLPEIIEKWAFERK